MVISLDTNIWIFGIREANPYCLLVLGNLDRFEVVVPNQVRLELERNLSQRHMRRFYELLAMANATIDYSPVASADIAVFEARGLRKGDAVIAAFCERHRITMFVSDNRDFLRHLLPPPNFEVLSPAEFCALFNLQQ